MAGRPAVFRTAGRRAGTALLAAQPPFGLSQFAAFLRLGWTRGGSPGIFGVPTG